MKVLVLLSTLIAVEADKLHGIIHPLHSSSLDSRIIELIPTLTSSFGEPRNVDSSKPRNEITSGNPPFENQGSLHDGLGSNIFGLSSDQINSGTNSFPISSETFRPCSQGEIRNVAGRCVIPQVRRNLFSVTIPEIPRPRGPAPILPPPKVENNILFVTLPETKRAEEPIVVPPPRQKNIIYLLNKKNQQQQKVITYPEQPKSSPEVYYVDYKSGENPILPLGVDLQSALRQAAPGTGQVISGQDTTGFGKQTLDNFNRGQIASGFGGQPESGVPNNLGGHISSSFPSTLDRPSTSLPSTLDRPSTSFPSSSARPTSASFPSSFGGLSSTSIPSSLDIQLANNPPSGFSGQPIINFPSKQPSSVSNGQLGNNLSSGQPSNSFGTAAFGFNSSQRPFLRIDKDDD